MLSPKTVEAISQSKNEPAWMREFRLVALKSFKNLEIAGLNLEEINYYQTPEIRSVCVPEKLKKALAGYEVQHDSEAVYGSIIKKVESQGVLFTDTDTALKKHPILREYFGKLILPSDNPFAALNSAFWSGGSFIYVPKGVKVTLPLQAYFKISAKKLGQFERTLIIADEGSEVTYIEGCGAEIQSSSALHAGVVEIFVKKGASVKYVTIQNWSSGVYNLVTKRARVEEAGTMRWLDVNIGSKLTIKYPSCFLEGRGAKGEMVSLSIASAGQVQDTGAKMFHTAPETTSNIISKSIALNGGKSIFRGKVEIKAPKCQSKTKCDALVLDPGSSAESYPTIKSETDNAQISHEATISRIEDDQLFYLQNRGLSGEQAESLIVNGFADSIVKQLPLEYALEIARMLESFHA